MNLATIFDYARLALGKAPDEANLTSNKDYWEHVQNRASQGIYVNELGAEHPFNPDCDAGKNYIRYVEKSLIESKRRYDFFFGNKDKDSQKPQTDLVSEYIQE